MSHAVGVTSEVVLTTDRDLSVPTVLKKHDVFYTSEIPEVMRYEPLYNGEKKSFQFYEENNNIWIYLYNFGNNRDKWMHYIARLYAEKVKKVIVYMNCAAE